MMRMSGNQDLLDDGAAVVGEGVVDQLGFDGDSRGPGDWDKKIWRKLGILNCAIDEGTCEETRTMVGKV